MPGPQSAAGNPVNQGGPVASPQQQQQQQQSNQPPGGPLPPQQYQYPQRYPTPPTSQGPPQSIGPPNHRSPYPPQVILNIYYSNYYFRTTTKTVSFHSPSSPQ